MTRIKIFPKRKSSSNQSTNNVITTVNTSPSQDSILPCYLTVNSNPNEYPSNSQSVIDENESPVLSKSMHNKLPLYSAIFLELFILTFNSLIQSC